MIPALAATSTDRNTTSNSSRLRPTTAPMNNGSRSAIVWFWSTNAAVNPPTRASMPVPASVAGMTSSRTVRSSASVASSCGDVDGTTPSTAVSPASFTVGGVTASTPSRVASCVRNASTSARVPPAVRSATTSRVPLWPGPYASVRMS